MTDKIRLDTALFEQGLAESREKAKALIMAGAVFVNGQRESKPGEQVKKNDSLEVHGNALPYVSRGGLKLQKAAEVFHLDFHEKTCLDVGASTGGFTDVMLQGGAKKVYAVDVGYGQLAWKLRTDERVVNLERTNFRYVTSEQIPEQVDFASADVAFISLRLILPVMYDFLKEESEAVCLIKPQFEAGRDKVGKKGVVRDKEVHKAVIRELVSFASSCSFEVEGLDFSPIKGPEGNIEYLMLLKKCASPVDCGAWLSEADSLVERSHGALDTKGEEK